MPRSIHRQAILDALGSLRPAVDRAEDNWSRAATHADRDVWWPRDTPTSANLPQGARRSGIWGAVARVRRREDDAGRRD